MRPLSNPISPNGGLAILHGNLAPEGAVVKIAGKKVLTFRGTARVFDNEEAAFEAVDTNRIKAGRLSSSSDTKDRKAAPACARCWR